MKRSRATYTYDNRTCLQTLMGWTVILFRVHRRALRPEKVRRVWGHPLAVGRVLPGRPYGVPQRLHGGLQQVSWIAKKPSRRGKHRSSLPLVVLEGLRRGPGEGWTLATIQGYAARFDYFCFLTDGDSQNSQLHNVLLMWYTKLSLDEFLESHTRYFRFSIRKDEFRRNPRSRTICFSFFNS